MLRGEGGVHALSSGPRGVTAPAGLLWLLAPNGAIIPLHPSGVPTLRVLSRGVEGSRRGFPLAGRLVFQQRLRS